MKYNKSLDFAALAIQASQAGRHVLAARLFGRAVTASDAGDALRIIEASNAKAHAEETQRLQAAVKASAAKRRLQASEGDEGCDEDAEGDDLDDLELGADLVDDVDPDVTPIGNDEDALEDDPSQEALAGDLDELEDEDDAGADADEDDSGEEDPAEAFASILASMVPAKAKVKASAVAVKKVAPKVTKK